MSPYRADTLCPGWVDKLICIWKLTGETKGLQFEAKNGLKSRVTNTEAVCSNSSQCSHVMLGARNHPSFSVRETFKKLNESAFCSDFKADRRAAGL